MGFLSLTFILANSYDEPGCAECLWVPPAGKTILRLKKLGGTDWLTDGAEMWEMVLCLEKNIKRDIKYFFISCESHIC